MNTPTKHTKEPWKVVKPGHGHETEYLCVQIGRDRSYTTLELKPQDARRIVACVNACASIPNPEVTIPKLIEALEKLSGFAEMAYAEAMAKCGPEAREMLITEAGALKLATDALAGVSK